MSYLITLYQIHLLFIVEWYERLTKKLGCANFCVEKDELAFSEALCEHLYRGVRKLGNQLSK